jgi:hypothetical protein
MSKKTVTKQKFLEIFRILFICIWTANHSGREKFLTYICVHIRLERVDTEQLRINVHCSWLRIVKFSGQKTYGCLSKMRNEWD